MSRRPGARRMTLALALLLAAPPARAGAEDDRRVKLDRESVAVLTGTREIYLEANPQRGEGMLRFAARLCGTSKVARELVELNGGARRLYTHRRYRVPFALLLPEHQLRLVRGLFDADEVRPEGWLHRVGPPGAHGRPSLWSVAEWFTGRGDNYRAIREHNGLADDELVSGQSILIPARLLRPALRSALPASSPYYLEYAEDRRGRYAVYRLKQGEALYSSVVVRFTGQVYSDDVNALAGEIAERSGIRNVKGIPVGYRVKIPFDLLLPEFLPGDHPRRREYEQGLLASSQFRNQVRAARLQEITVILDAGHGGTDVGASLSGVWESLYVYDIMVRTKELLEGTTAARVEVLVRDGEEFRIHDQDVLPRSRGHFVLTDPRYPISDSTVGLHLRWYLANSLFRRSLQSAADAAKVVFLSIHADSLHSSLRGAMAYVPGARYREGTYGKSGAVYAARREVKERPTVSFSRSQRVKSEGLSRELARTVIEAFDRQGLPVHADRPIREKVIRKRRAWVPAILRYNEVPAQMLLEVCNIANSDDRKLLQTRDFRQRVAEAIVAGIVDYYRDGETEAEVRVAATSG